MTCMHPNDDHPSGYCGAPVAYLVDVSSDGGAPDVPMCADCALIDMPRCGYPVRPI